MNVLSLFSGVGGMDRGLENAGHHIVAMCEIDPQARSVLAVHWPYTPIFDDVTTFNGKTFNGQVDLVAGGSPCQDLSVAGRREGLDGARSGLFWHQCRIATETSARWVLWENVAGALSSNNGHDFAAVLWGLTGTWPDVPEDGWRSGGVCVGPDRTAIWRMLDARHFGVAQRRRRVFVIAGPRNECSPEILFESESCGGHPHPGDTTRETNPTHAADRIATTHQQLPGWSLPAVSAPVTAKWAKGTGGPSGDECQNLTVTAAFDSTWSGRYPISTDDICPTIKVGSSVGAPAPPAVCVSAFSENQRGEIVLTDYAHQITTGGGKPGQGYPAVAYPFNQSLAVRRLTPTECETLMGWEKNWTQYGVDNKLMTDTSRYRFCGNGVVSNITEWIGKRLPAS